MSNNIINIFKAPVRAAQHLAHRKEMNICKNLVKVQNQAEDQAKNIAFINKEINAHEKHKAQLEQNIKLANRLKSQLPGDDKNSVHIRTLKKFGLKSEKHALYLRGNGEDMYLSAHKGFKNKSRELYCEIRGKDYSTIFPDSVDKAVTRHRILGNLSEALPREFAEINSKVPIQTIRNNIDIKKQQDALDERNKQYVVLKNQLVEKNSKIEKLEPEAEKVRLNGKKAAELLFSTDGLDFLNGRSESKPKSLDSNIKSFTPGHIRELANIGLTDKAEKIETYTHNSTLSIEELRHYRIAANSNSSTTVKKFLPVTLGQQDFGKDDDKNSVLFHIEGRPYKFSSENDSGVFFKRKTEFTVMSVEKRQDGRSAIHLREKTSP
ncbi:hypothetical protein [Pseudomonas gingeri]|uniref:Uncharacterized protein n=1 Tax=Pseudomonas gingeri TaxID=117681 RepID=A0A7Y7YCJ1_9PSED|nr:hypothetical protein [Pseudomonas gingeri]NWB30393.1 hypothetical protein [Pseudomonas gingeri]NWC33762.1 hypothetical protein [Pseudomonas gingeri]